MKPSCHFGRPPADGSTILHFPDEFPCKVNEDIKLVNETVTDAQVDHFEKVMGTQVTELPISGVHSTEQLNLLLNLKF